MMTNIVSPIIDEIINDSAVRRRLAFEQHSWFFGLYFGHYITHRAAPFHQEMFALSQAEDIPLVVITAFRNSAKSAIMTMSLPIWSILGKHQKKFVLILSQTQPQARIHLHNLKRELETNELLRADLGPFEEADDEWGATTLVIPKYGARIMIASSEQSIRGSRHGPHRPDLIICDDIEDLASNKTKESRDKTFNWLTGEVIPAGDQRTKVIVVGNLLHEDSLLMRLKGLILTKKLDGEYREYPLLDADGRILWPAKFPNMEAIEKLRQRQGDEAAFSREYLLKIISDIERVIHPDWLHFYDELPQSGLRYQRIGIDLAISEKDTADYTAMVPVAVYGWDEQMKLYVLPNLTNKRLTNPQTVEVIQKLFHDLGGRNKNTEILIEDVGYQRSLVQQMSTANFPTKGCPVRGQDKRARLALTGHPIQNGTVLFPRQGAEQLITQMTYFGVEKHDDLADAFSMVVNDILDKGHRRPRIFAEKPDLFR